MLITAAILAILSIPLFFLGLRGRRVDDHPVCRKCKFDLVGVYPETKVCPECGRDQAETAPRTGNRRKRWRIVLAGALFLAGGATLSALEVREIVKEHGWVRLEPTFWLKRDVLSDNAATVARAARELWWRVEERGLDTATFKGTIERVLKRQSNLERTWVPDWGGFVESARSYHAISDEQWLRYAEGIYCNAVLVPRSPVRVGDVVPFTVEIEARCSQSAPFGVVFKTMPSAVNGERSVIIVQSEYDEPWNNAHPGANSFMADGVTGNRGHKLPFQIYDYDPIQPYTWRLDHVTVKAVGKATIETQVYGYLFEIPDFRMRYETLNKSVPTDALVQKMFEVSASFDVVDASTQTITLVTDTRLAPAITNSKSTVQRRTKDHWFGIGYLDVARKGASLAFEVFWQAGDHEWRVGSLCDIDTNSFNANRIGHFRMVEGFDPVKTPVVNVILRPSKRLARQTPNMTEIWGEEIVIKDVLIEGPRIPEPAQRETEGIAGGGEEGEAEKVGRSETSRSETTGGGQ